MRLLRVVYVFAAAVVMVGCGSEQRDLTAYVNPFVGTGGHGHTFPGATRPHSMVQLSPDTHLLGWDASSGYHSEDSLIYAFSHTHLSGTGIGDLGDVALLPYSGNDTLPVASFLKTSERATPGYYAVRLENYGVDVELTSTQRVGIHRYKYDNSAQRKVMLNLSHILQPNWQHSVVSNSIKMLSDSVLTGTFKTKGWAEYHTVNYVINFSEPIQTVDVLNNGKSSVFKAGDNLFSDKNLKLFFSFADSKNPLLVKVGISPVDHNGAINNLNTELSGWDFDAVAAESKQIWNKALSKIEIKSDDQTVIKNFYTSLYHTMIAPILWQDVDGRYLGMDKQIHQAPKGYVNYTAFSLWDTFRALHPLMTIIDPQLASDFGDVLFQGYKEGTILPKWPLASSYTGCMVGYPAVSVLADLQAKGLARTDALQWLEAAKQSSVYREDLAKKFAGTRELDLITKHTLLKDKYGFVPADLIPESVSWGLEMAYYDWAIAQMAAAAADSATYKTYMEKSLYYQRYIDPQTKMMRGIMSNGEFRTPFNPRYSAHMESDYCEGNAYQWSYFIPHDMDNYIAKIGGKGVFEAILDTLFTTSSQIDGNTASGDITGLIGQYAHGNEPSHHIAYLYNWTDSPRKGADYLDYIMREFYTQDVDGIIGNEDCGQMSAWYVLSAMGFYQVCPGLPVYTLGRPMVDYAAIAVDGGVFEIVVKNNSPENNYIKKATINSKTLSSPFFSHSEIKAGGRLEIEMTN